MNSIIALLEANNWNRQHPATEEEINSLKEKFGIDLPEDFDRLLRFSNGGSMYGFKTPFIVFSVLEILRLYKEFDYYTEVPQFLIWGADGGGMLYAYDLRGKTFAVCCFYLDDPGYDKLIYKSMNMTETVSDIINGRKING